MKVTPTSFRGLYVLKPNVFSDERGSFSETYNLRTLQELGMLHTFVQVNQSFSTHGVLRGLHFQKNPYAQTKLVWPIAGSILDVVVDLRKNEATFGKSFSIELSEKNNLQLLVPKGFAHAFVVLSETARVLYQCDSHYHKASEGGIRFDDPDLSIDWKLSTAKFVLSEKDKNLPFLRDLDYHF